MFDATEWLSQLKRQRVIGVVRSGEAELAYQMGATLAQAGIRLIEITWDCPEVATIIPRLQGAYPDCWVGTGTILTLADLQRALTVGVDFIFTPHTEREWLTTSLSAGVPLVPGALTPTEILQAYRWGAPAVIHVTQTTPSVSLMEVKASSPAWRDKPSWYILATNDRAVPSDLQRDMSQRMSAKTVTVKSSHFPMISHPKEVLEVIREATASSQ